MTRNDDTGPYPEYDDYDEHTGPIAGTSPAGPADSGADPGRHRVAPPARGSGDRASQVGRRTPPSAQPLRPTDLGPGARYEREPATRALATPHGLGPEPKETEIPATDDDAKPAGAGARRRRPLWRRISRWAAVVAILLILIPIVVFAIAYYNTSVPSPESLQAKEPREVSIYMNSSDVAPGGVPRVDGNGKPVTNPVKFAEIVPSAGKRDPVKLAQVPMHVRQAVIAAEDRDFYNNPGFDLRALGRAAWGQLTGDDSRGGGSTITQQYVKNALVGDERSYTRKFRELVIATKMAREWSKDAILEAYLNTIYFGRGAYGISQAAQAYFGKKIGDITVAEGAILASVIQSPSSMDPMVNRAASEYRWTYVMDGLVSIGAIGAAERAATPYPINAVISAEQARASEVRTAGPDGLIKTQVSRELAQLVQRGRLTEDEVATRGLQVYTTINRQQQDAAVQAVHSTLRGEPANLRGAVVSIDPRTGAVRAYYGGDDPVGFDRAAAPQPTGSTFKVFALAAGLEQGIPLSQTYSDAPYTVGRTTIQNSDGASCGGCNLATALRQSINTTFYRLEAALRRGPNDIADMAHRAGVPVEPPGYPNARLKEPDGSVDTGIVLGKYSTRPLDMASAFGTFAASGIQRPPHFIERIVDMDGNLLYDNAAPEGTRAMEAKVADNVTAAMAPIAADSNGNALAGGRVSAAKTGTAQLGNTGSNRDAWMIGFTPQLSTAVWVGTDTGTEPIRTSSGRSIYGSGLPSTIWRLTMNGAHRGLPLERFPKPGAIGGVAGVPAETTRTTQSTETTTEGSSATPTPEVSVSQPLVTPFPGLPPIPGGPPVTVTIPRESTPPAVELPPTPVPEG